MDYSKFVDAVLEKDDAAISELEKVITPVLIKFLMVRLGATHTDAKDCAQNTLLIAIQRIREHKVKHPEALINYLFTTAKREYYKQLSRSREINEEELSEKYFKEADQLDRLLSEEKLSILEVCMEELSEDNRAFMDYWFENPSFEASEVANHFNLTVSNVWTKKHRLIQALKECVQKKIQL